MPPYAASNRADSVCTTAPEQPLNDSLAVSEKRLSELNSNLSAVLYKLVPPCPEPSGKAGGESQMVCLTDTARGISRQIDRLSETIGRIASVIG